MPPLAAESVWRNRASDLIKTQLSKAGLTYAELSVRLEQHGFRESKDTIGHKLLRGSFSAAFLLAVLAVLNADRAVLDVPDIETN